MSNHLTHKPTIRPMQVVVRTSLSTNPVNRVSTIKLNSKAKGDFTRNDNSITLVPHAYEKSNKSMLKSELRINQQTLFPVVQNEKCFTLTNPQDRYSSNITQNAKIKVKRGS